VRDREREREREREISALTNSVGHDFAVRGRDELVNVGLMRPWLRHARHVGSYDHHRPAHTAASPPLKNTVGGGKNLQFSDRRNIGAQNFNFATKFHQNGGISAPNFVFFFWKNIFRQGKIQCGAVAHSCPPATTPLIKQTPLGGIRAKTVAV